MALKTKAFFYRSRYHSEEANNLRLKNRAEHLNVLEEYKQCQQKAVFVPCFESFKYTDQKELLVHHQKQTNKQKDNPLQGYLLALLHYNIFLESNLKNDQLLFFKELKQANQNAVSKNNQLALVYPKAFEKYNLKANWTSGISQALACSANLRAFHLSGEKTYLQQAKAFLLFAEDEKNGLKIKGPEFGYWIEEYPSDPPSFVLNGFIFYIIATLELEALSAENANSNIYIESLVKNLHLYISGDEIFYDLHKKQLANRLYKNIHKKQLEHLQSLTGFSGFSALNNLSL